MIRIRSAIAAALMVFGGATLAAAQQPTQQPTRQAAGRGKMQHARKAQARLFKGVQLSTTEKASLKAVRQKYAAQRKALRASNTVDRSQAMSLRQAERNDIRGALGAANQTKFDANAAAMKRRMEKRNKAIKP